ncbi:MAG: DJ-1/PfpI family protein [Puniceicoccales bacterium]
MSPLPSKPVIGTILFPGFELLDTFGPLELFLILPELFDCVMLAEDRGAVTSSQGPVSLAEASIRERDQVDILLAPGGKGTRTEVDHPELIAGIERLANRATYVCTVCTGAALLARTGLLDHQRATTNKAAWKWATAQGPHVDWVAEARWVEDGKFFTSSGVSAGMDMALALIQKIYGEETCRSVAEKAEYVWNHDSTCDPFARIHGLVE